MASSSKKSAARANNKLLGKRVPEDDLENKPILKKHKEKETTEGFAAADILQQIKRKVDFFEAEFVKGAVDGFDEPFYVVEEVAARKKTLLVDNLSPQTKISDIIGFFHNVGEIVGVKLTINRLIGDARLGVVEFASANEAKKALKKKNGECLCGHNIVLRVTDKRLYPPPRPKYYFDHKAVWYEDYLRQESLLIGHDEDTDSVSVRKKTVFVANLSPQSNIIAVCKFFRNVGQVVSVRLIANHEGKHVGFGFVEFVSANEAKKAMEKNGEYLHDHKIFLDVPKIAPHHPRPKHNLAENPWYEDFLCQESLVTEEDETVERLDKDPDYVEEVAGRKKTLFIGNLSPQTEVLDICIEFHRVGEVVHVRLNVDHKGEHAGYGFVEFVSANEAKKALEEKNGVNVHGRKIVLDVAKGAKYPPPEYYCTDHKVWYKDYLRRESLLIEEVETLEGLVQEVFIRKKTLFVANLSPRTDLSDVCNFFHNVGRAVSTRLIVNHEGKHVGCAFVEFASVNQAKKVLKKMNGRNLRGRKIFLDVAKIAPYPPRPKYNLVEKLWYEDYLGRQQDDLMETKPPIVRFCGTKTTFD